MKERVIALAGSLVATLGLVLADQLPVGRRRGLEQRDAGFDFFEQDAFGGSTLLSREFAEFERRAVGSQNPFAQGAQALEPLFQRDEPRVGDGVRGAGEQISESNLRTNRTRQHAR